MAANILRIVPILICVVILADFLEAQDSVGVVILNPKVGEVIDLAERNHYALFLSIKNFSSAAIVRLTGEIYEARITIHAPSGDSMRIIILPEASVFNLAEKIEHFEELKNGTYVFGTQRPSILVNGNVVEWKPVVHPEQIAQRVGSKVLIILKNGEQYSGYMLYTSNSALVIWKSTEQYNSNMLDTEAIKFSSSEIYRIVIEREGHFLSGVGAGLLAGGGFGALIGFASGDDKDGFFRFTAAEKALLLGIVLGVPSAVIGGIAGAAQGVDDDFIVNGDNETYLKVVQKLRENAMFPSILPWELQEFLQQDNPNISSRKTDLPLQEPPETSEQNPARFHFSISSATQLKGYAAKDMEAAFISSEFGGTYDGWFGPITYPIVNSNFSSWNIAAEYNLTECMQLGMTWEKFPRIEVEGRGSMTEYIEGSSYAALFSYVPYPSAPLFVSRLELAFAAGVSYNTIKIGGTSIFDAVEIGSTTSSEFTAQKLGVHLRTSCDYYFSRYFSLQGKIEGTLIPSVSVPAIHYINQYSSEIKTLMPHKVNLSGMNVSFGIRCHL